MAKFGGWCWKAILRVCQWVIETQNKTCSVPNSNSQTQSRAQLTVYVQVCVISQSKESTDPWILLDYVISLSQSHWHCLSILCVTIRNRQYTGSGSGALSDTENEILKEWIKQSTGSQCSGSGVVVYYHHVSDTETVNQSRALTHSTLVLIMVQGSGTLPDNETVNQCRTLTHSTLVVVVWYRVVVHYHNTRHWTNESKQSTDPQYTGIGNGTG